MSHNPLTESDLARELSDYHEAFPKFEGDELFVLWFLRAYMTDDDDKAAAALCGTSGDKGIDAVLVDTPSRSVFVAQGKYREMVGGKSEKRADVVSFAEMATSLLGEEESYHEFIEDAAPEVQQRLDGARKRLLQDGYRLQLYYVTLGRCSAKLIKEAGKIAKHAGAVLDIISGERVMLLLSDYLDGVAPPIPTLDLEMTGGDGVTVQGVFHQYDDRMDIESWVFSMTSQGVARLYQQAGNRLFARNVRGFLQSSINSGLESTLKTEPERFWYYNNGVTVICDQAEEALSQGNRTLRLRNPQVINGQQTTRTLSRVGPNNSKASVLVRVIRVPRSEDGSNNHFDALVSKIVSATNSQNAIRASDLMSNDRRQIQIERQLRKLRYWYERKRQSKRETRRNVNTRIYRIIRKDELAQAVAACNLDPSLVREGKEGLFEERLYSQVFPSADPYYYLARYWLMREVSYAARGYPKRAYAKWLVLNFMWTHFQKLIPARARVEVFRRAWEQGTDTYLFDNLFRAINAAFKATLQFYSRKSGHGAKAIDISTFFQRRKLHEEFAVFWRGSNNLYRKPFNTAWKRVTADFNQAMLE